MTDITWVGKVSKINVKSGNSNGRDWTKTSFVLTKTIATREGNKASSYIVSSFYNLSLVDGGIYCVGLNVKNRKQQDGKFSLELDAEFAEPVYVPRQQTNNYQNNYQSTGYQNNYQEPQQNGVQDDDIPF
ncbi:hypothetical protein [uncultured Pediococcus sp.]|uniref:hypothetical protein n=1 Tax=uncultured Pediococcus sp. TaxID=165192 RepID=UPI00259B6F58|nr:hypothetical protein [uncultured Pediococcus sp.]